MYEELGGVREPVALSPQEVLDSAEALLTQQDTGSSSVRPPWLPQNAARRAACSDTFLSI